MFCAAPCGVLCAALCAVGRGFPAEASCALLAALDATAVDALTAAWDTSGDAPAVAAASGALFEAVGEAAGVDAVQRKLDEFAREAWEDVCLGVLGVPALGTS